MRTSCTMIALRVTPPAEDEEAKVDEAVEARGVVVSVRGRLGLSYASLHLTVVASIALITVK